MEELSMTTIQKPEINFVHVNYREWSDGSFHFTFDGFADKNIRSKYKTIISFTSDAEPTFLPTNIKPTESALDALDDIIAVLEDYWISHQLEPAKELRGYLASIEDEQAILRANYKIDHARYKIEEWIDKLSEAQTELEELKDE